MYIIGDLHGSQARHIELCSLADINNDVTLQIGDLGYSYQYLDNINANNHKFIAGNHENYSDLIGENNIHLIPHSLGEYGSSNHLNDPFFFVRGEFSIDKSYREKMFYSGLWPKTWFANEEIHFNKHPDVFQSYQRYCGHNKFRCIISHGCPTIIAKKIGNPDILRNWKFDPDIFETDTQRILQEMFDYCKPNLWIFGHWHRNLQFKFNSTTFVCIKDQDYLHIPSLTELLL